MNAQVSIVTRTEAAICHMRIDTLMATQPEITGVLISTVDGFEIASKLSPGLSAAKLAAMTSSLLALSGAMCAETANGTCRDLVIDADAGRVLLMELPHRNQNLVLAVLCTGKVTLGQVLWAVRSCREDLSRRLNVL
jgi:predicted regulator of Ras-like GTPase activity (Roadblock/LC7/MglB family)